MRPLPRDIPRGYGLHRVADSWLVLDTALRRDLIELRLADPDAREALFARAQRRGRGRAPTVSLGRETSLVLRRYRHGGLLGWLTRTWLWGPRRALWELQITARAERARAPVPHVACLALWPVAGPLWSALIGTVEVERGEELLAWLLRLDARTVRGELARQVGAAIRRLHSSGISHRDLQLRNILVRWDAPADAPPQIVVIDLDGASYHGTRGVPTRRRASNLGRLLRSAIKLGLWQSRVGRRECAAFLSGYLAGDRELRRELRSCAALERAKLLWHRAGYQLKREPAGREAQLPPPSA